MKTMRAYNNATVKAIADHYGAEKQSVKAAEELAELIQATLKHRADPGNPAVRNGFIEELADVMIMTDQLKYLYKITDVDVAIVAAEKLARQCARVRAEKENQ